VTIAIPPRRDGREDGHRRTAIAGSDYAAPSDHDVHRLPQRPAPSQLSIFQLAVGSKQPDN